MEPILSLPPAQFRAALAELNLPRDRADALRRQYRLQNSPLAGLYGLLDRAGQGEEGMEAATFLPVSRPEGMSVADAIRSGEAGIAVPQGLLDAVGGVARALDAPSAAAAGLIPREDMIGEALNVAGAAQLGGAAMPAPRGALRSAALGTADEVMESPAQRVARLLRNGRADEVTDDLMAQADPQEMYRLYVAGETGMDLPMDQLSRELRAEQMGFMDRPETYHGTGDDIQAFRVSFRPDPLMEGGTSNVGVYSAARPIVAESYAPNIHGGNIIPLATRPTHYDVRVSAPGANWNTIPEGALVTTNTGTVGQLADVFPNAFDDVADPFLARTNSIAREANRDGAGSVFFEGITDQGGFGDPTGMRHIGPSDIQTDFYPHNIRSRFARFDPRLSHLANLNAANIDPLTGAAAMGASQQQQDPLASLRAYLAATGGVLGR